MLLIIHNLPHNTTYNDVKGLLQAKCGLQEVILDNLMYEGTNKKVTVGVAEEDDAAILVRKINGMFLNGQQLYVEDLRQTRASEQPYLCSTNLKSHQYNHVDIQQQPTGLFPTMSNFAMMYPQPNTVQPFQNNNLGFRNQTQQVMNQFDEYSQFNYQKAQQPVERVETMSTDHMQSRSDIRWGGNARQEQCPQPEWHTPATYAPAFAPTRECQDDPAYNSRDASTYNRYDGPRHDGRDGHAHDIRTGRVPERRDGLGYNRRDGPISDRLVGPTYETRDSSSYQSHGNRRASSPNRNEITRFSKKRHWNEPDERQSGQENHDDRRRPTQSNKFSRNTIYHNESKYRYQREKSGSHSQREQFQDSYQPGQGRGTQIFNPSIGRDGASSSQNRETEHPIKKYARLYDNPRYDNTSFRRDGPQQVPTTKDYDRPLNLPDQNPKSVQYSQPKRHFPREHDAVPLPTEGPKPADKRAMKREKANRIMGTNAVMYEMATNLKTEGFVSGHPAKKIIRESVLARINKLSGTNITNDKDHFYKLYRQKYSIASDAAFYNECMSRVPKGTVLKKKFNHPPVNPVKETALTSVPPGNIPNYAEDRWLLKAQRRQHRKEMKELSTESYQLDPKYKNAIDSETAGFDKVFDEIFDAPANDTVRSVYEMVDLEALKYEFRQVIALHLTRRITDGGMKLVRIFGHPKFPCKTDLEQALLPFGVQSLKKSVRTSMYTGTVDTYENLDKLCNLKEIQVGNVTITVKPMHVVPQKNRKNYDAMKSKHRAMVRKLIEYSEIDLLDKNWQIQEQAEKQRKASSETNKVNANEIKVEFSDAHVKAEKYDGDDKEITQEIMNPTVQVVKQEKTSLEKNNASPSITTSLEKDVEASSSDGNAAPTVGKQSDENNSSVEKQTGMDDGTKVQNQDKNFVQEHFPAIDELHTSDDEGYAVGGEDWNDVLQDDEKADNQEANGEDDDEKADDQEANGEDDDEPNENDSEFNVLDTDNIDLDNIDEDDLEDY